jgi:hypothetical protein
MISEKRLVQIESALTPKQGVLLWLGEEFQGKTSQEYDRWLVQQRALAAPRSRVTRQVAGAVQAAMEGQDPARVQRAVRQAQMETDFLILLVSRANSAVRDHCNSVSHRIASFLMRLHVGGSRHEDASAAIVADLRSAATELFSTRLAIERIRARYFSDECILAKDVDEGLERPTTILRLFIEGLDRELEENGHPELVIDSEDFRNIVIDQASKKVRYICALAKSEMLRHFVGGDAANAILKPYVLGDQ